MSNRQFQGFSNCSFSDMYREERKLAMESFRAGNVAQGEIHFNNAVTFARCDAAEKAEQRMNHL